MTREEIIAALGAIIERALDERLVAPSDPQNSEPHGGGKP